MKGGKVTVDALAKMIQKEVIAKMATKSDMGALNDRVDSNFKLLVEEIRLIRDDLHDIHSSIKSLVGIVGRHDKDITRLKEHAGFGD